MDQVDPDWIRIRNTAVKLFFTMGKILNLSQSILVTYPWTVLNRAFKALHNRIICVTLVRKIPILYFCVSLPDILYQKECVTRWIFFVDLKIYISTGTGIFCTALGDFKFFGFLVEKILSEVLTCF